jgi:hypothetical protein
LGGTSGIASTGEPAARCCGNRVGVPHRRSMRPWPCRGPHTAVRRMDSPCGDGPDHRQVGASAGTCVSALRQPTKPVPQLDRLVHGGNPCRPRVFRIRSGGRLPASHRYGGPAGIHVCYPGCATSGPGALLHSLRPSSHGRYTAHRLPHRHVRGPAGRAADATGLRPRPLRRDPWGPEKRPGHTRSEGVDIRHGACRACLTRGG